MKIEIDLSFKGLKKDVAKRLLLYVFYTVILPIICFYIGDYVTTFKPFQSQPFPPDIFGKFLKMLFGAFVLFILLFIWEIFYIFCICSKNYIVHGFFGVNEPRKDDDWY